MGSELSPAEVLARVPQQEPFRFIEAIHELDREHIVASYRFPQDADFYRGHFPGNPITPGVILIETMAQAGVVALGIYLYALEVGAEEVEAPADEGAAPIGDAPGGGDVTARVSSATPRGMVSARSLRKNDQRTSLPMANANWASASATALNTRGTSAYWLASA